MKKRLTLILCMVFAMAVIINSSLLTAYGESDGWLPIPGDSTGNSVNAAAVNSAITSEDVSRGLAFCREYPVIVQLQGKQVATTETEVPPVIVGSRTLIPARSFFETLGAQVEWDDMTRTVKIISEDMVVELAIDSNLTHVNGMEKLLDVPAMIIDHDGDGFGSTMLPLRFVSEGLGFQVSWEENTRTASVARVEPEPVPEPEEEQDPEEEQETEQESEGEDTPVFDTKHGELNELNSIARKKLVVIDIGHGGRDTGAIAYEDTEDEIFEKDINLEVGLRLRDLLDQAGFNYLFTRESDESLSLYDRPAFANDNDADIFISLHNNSSERSAPKGTEVYYNSKVNEEGEDEEELYGIYSRDIALLVQKEMVAILGTDNRGAKSGEKLAVLNKTSMPAIVVEGAFLSNPDDYAIIADDDYCEMYAYAVAKGLIAAMNKAF